MPAAITDKISKASNGTRPVPTTLTATRAVGATSISCGALTGWQPDRPTHFIIYKVNTAGQKVAGSQLDCKGIVSGNTITSIQYKAGSDTGHDVGDVVEAAPTAAYADELAEWQEVEHDVDGTHKNVTTDTLSVSSTSTFTGAATFNGGITIAGTSNDGGWLPPSGTITAVSNNGNRSYTLTTSADLRTTISNGMRLRTTNTVAGPTQCTSLNGTNQFWNDTTVAGMTFTDDFVVGAWVKLSSYAVGTIVSRFNGTSGWTLELTAAGQLNITGFNGGGGNASYAISYQSLPLNKWVHVTAQLDMSAFAATSTTTYFMIDGVDVPCSVTRIGTNPTALVQAGNLEVGSRNGGTQPFSGKIASAFVASAKITQANVRTLMGQTITAAQIASHSIVSAYSFDGNANDLNTTNANNLTAQNSATATNADSYTGIQADGTVSSTLNYGIVTNVGPTSVTTQAPEGNTIPTTGGISAFSYSTYKAPYGFPAQSSKWVIEVLNKVDSTSPANSTYNHNVTITVPTGEWSGIAKYNLRLSNSSAGPIATIGLSTSSSSLSDRALASTLEQSTTNSSIRSTLTIDVSISAATATQYYTVSVSGNAGTGQALYDGAGATVSSCRLANAYL